MSTEAVSTSQTVQFPAKAAIIAYVGTHPMFKVANKLELPNIFDELARYFSTKNMVRDEIGNEVKEIIEALIDEAGTDDQKNYMKMTESEKQYLEAGVGAMFEVDVKLKATINSCKRIMQDCIDKRAYPAGGISLEKRISLTKKPGA